jgi:Fic family protein
MNFSPIIPAALNGSIDSTLLDKAHNLIVESSCLTANHTPQLLNSVRTLLYSVNSYYSNKIESKGTHIIDIERAMNKDYFEDTHKRNLQNLSLVHIKIQKEIEQIITKDADFSAYNSNFIQNVHHRFYSDPKMLPFLHVHHDDMAAIINPGKFRTNEVKVGTHIPPHSSELISCMNEFEFLYNKSLYSNKAVQLLHAFSSHHRLVWIHPFLDGNGRVSRLVLDAALHNINLAGYGLWNISRGLARDAQQYKSLLQYADMKQQGITDGKGPLSLRGLTEFVNFMLDTSLDQVQYMRTQLQINTLSKRITKFIALAKSDMIDVEALPLHSDKLLTHLLLVGECTASEVEKIIGKKSSVSSKLITDLLKRNYLTRVGSKGVISININATFASYIFPDLVPQY